ncbi:MAG: hypothetical protein WCF98_11195 [Synechococcus sp. ELA057]|jgi:hypothetical protein
MTAPVAVAGSPDPRACFGMAPGIRFTLLALYLALVLPLPFMAPEALRLPLLLAVPLGLGLVLAISSEQVVLSPDGIELSHPRWCSWLLRRGWSLRWSEITGLTPVGTSQGGRVFYLRTAGAGRAYLLPQRLERFDDFLDGFARLSGLDCQAVGRLTPPWTYQVLAAICALLLVAELAALILVPPAMATGG